MREPAGQKWGARAILLAGAVAGLAWIHGLDFHSKVSTDVLDLVPSDERSPELALVRSMAGEDEAKILLLALRVPAKPGETAETRSARGERAAEAFARALASSPAIAEALPMTDTGPRDALAAAVFSQRLDLLLPGWLVEQHRRYEAARSPLPWSAWLAEESASGLQAYLARPEAVATQDILGSDPLLLVSRLVDQVAGLGQGGTEAARTGDYALVWAKSRASPLKPEGQGPVFAAVDTALQQAALQEPGTELRWTGIARFAAASRARIENEMTTLNLLSLGLVIIVASVCVRRVHRAFQLAPVVIGSLLGAWVATTAAWDRVHILVFVVGSLLAGVAVDYGFYLYLQPLRRADEPYRERASRLIRPLLASALTTVIGFSFLLWSELPLIRQVGVFVSAGLVCALLTALLWFAQLDDSHLETRAFVRRRVAHPGPGLRNAARALLVAGAAVALLGPWRLHWRDDIRELEIPTPELKANDQAVRTLFGKGEASTVFITRGDTPSKARDNLESFLAWHGEHFPAAATATLGYALPTSSEIAAAQSLEALLAPFDADLRAALVRHGFEPAAFEAFFGAWREHRTQTTRPGYAELVSRLSLSLKGPMASLIHVGPSGSWLVTIAEEAPGAEPPASTSTVTDSQLENLNRLFGRYRLSALRLSSAGLAFVGASVLVLYGLRRGVRIFAVPAGACLFAFGLFGILGLTLNLFNLLGAFLGVCLSHNYAIFSAESRGMGEDPPPSIRMSAVATASSFGVLALSRIPVVASLGATVTVIVLAALAIAELSPLASGADESEDSGL